MSRRVELTIEEREQMFRVFVRTRSIRAVSRECDRSRKTVTRYQQIDQWDRRRADIEAKAQVATDRQETKDRTRMASIMRGVVQALAETVLDREGEKVRLGAGIEAKIGDLDRSMRTLLVLNQEPESRIMLELSVLGKGLTSRFVQSLKDIIIRCPHCNGQLTTLQEQVIDHVMGGLGSLDPLAGEDTNGQQPDN